MKLQLILVSLIMIGCSSADQQEKRITYDEITGLQAQFKSVSAVTGIPLPASKLPLPGNYLIYSSGNRIYILDISTRTAYAIAGSGSAVHSDGTLLTAGIPTTTNLSQDSSGKFYALYQDKVRVIDTYGNSVSTHSMPVAIPNPISDCAVSSDGTRMYYVQTGDNAVYQFVFATLATSIHSGSNSTGDVIGTLTNARYTGPQLMHQVTDGYLIIDFYNQKVKHVNTSVLNDSCTKKNSDIASSIGVDGIASSCTFGYITSSYYKADAKELYFIESWSVIRKMKSDGSVVTLGKPFNLNSVTPIYNITVSSINNIYITSSATVYEIVQ